MEYIVAKLISGETIVSLTGELQGDLLNLIHPFEVVQDYIHDDESSSIKTSLRPLCPYTSSDIIPMSVSCFVYIAPLKPDLAEIYKSMVDAFIEADSSDEDTVKTDLSFTVDAVNTIQ